MKGSKEVNVKARGSLPLPHNAITDFEMQTLVLTVPRPVGHPECDRCKDSAVF